MFLKFDADTLEALSEGVVMLNHQGVIVDFNRAAKPWLPVCNKAAVEIKAAVSRVVRNHIKTPLVMDLPGTDAAFRSANDVRLCENGQTGFLLLITQKRLIPAAVNDTDQSNGVCQLMVDAVRHALTELLCELGAIRNAEALAALAPLEAHVLHVRSLFVAMDQLARLDQLSSMYPGNRLSVPDLLSTAIGFITQGHCDYYKDLSSGEFGPVYGRTSWIACALTALLEGMEAGAPRRSGINLTVRQNGGFVTISARNSSGSNLGGSIPFQSEGVNDAILQLVASTRIPLARRIVEMHGGMVHVTELDAENADKSFALESFTLQLPTGLSVAPHTGACKNCPVNLQTEAYAFDLAALTPWVPEEAQVSEEERVLLNSLTSARE